MTSHSYSPCVPYFLKQVYMYNAFDVDLTAFYITCIFQPHATRLRMDYVISSPSSVIKERDFGIAVSHLNSVDDW